MTSPHPTSDPVPAMDDIQVGDVVHVRGVVREIQSFGYVIGTDGQRTLVVRDSIVRVEPRPLKVGDKIRHGAIPTLGDLLAINGDFGWVAFSNKPTTIRLSELRRA